MYLYCACPDEKFKSNFIKIDCCQSYEKLKEIFEECSQVYGNSYIKHFIEIDEKISKKDLYKILKIKELHIENGLFILDDKHNFSYYVQKMNNISL